MRRSFFVAAVGLASLIAGATSPAGAVVGGQPADPGEWPWQMAVLVDGQLWCGGSLLAPDLVLTAAHCTDGLGPSDLEVLGGTVDLRGDEGERRSVIAIDQHEGYDEGGLSNDISLITLEAPFEVGGAIDIVQVAGVDESAARTEEGDPAVVTGFGATGEDEPASDVLLEAELGTLADDRCEALYRVDGDAVIGRSQVCAGRDRGHVDACYGDSGGPLVVPVDTERSGWRLVGIVSWGAGCGAPLRPTVYTEVAAFADWLALRGVGPEAGERHEGDGARLPALGTRGKASRYPLTVDVSGFDGPLEAISVRLLGLSHERPEDLDVWLVAPDGTVVTLLSDVGGVADLEAASLLVVDGARAATRAALGTQIGPTDREGDDQRKGATPPADLSVLRGIDPNGVWQLLVADDHPGARGTLDAWSLQLT